MSCKECVQFLAEDAFYFREKPPEGLHRSYCQACYDAKIAPDLAAYEQELARAKEIFVFHKKHGYLRILRRSKQRLSIRDCKDREDVVLRLAFIAAQLGYNSLIEVELIAEKVRISGYQTSNWTGTGVPADVEPEKEGRNRLI